MAASESPVDRLGLFWACQACPQGSMRWYACDLRNSMTILDHKFACDYCGQIEHLILPFRPVPRKGNIEVA